MRQRRRVSEISSFHDSIHRSLCRMHHFANHPSQPFPLVYSQSPSLCKFLDQLSNSACILFNISRGREEMAIGSMVSAPETLCIQRTSESMSMRTTLLCQFDFDLDPTDAQSG